MKYTIYQLDTSTDHGASMLFMGLLWNRQHGNEPKSTLYREIYSGTIEGGNPTGMLEHLYTIFNLDQPNDYRGHSLSVSDVVALDGEAYYCDHIGWKPLPNFFN